MPDGHRRKGGLGRLAGAPRLIALIAAVGLIAAGVAQLTGDDDDLSTVDGARHSENVVVDGPGAAPASLPAPADMAPSRLLIPDLGVYAPVDTMEVTGGQLQVPANPARVGWDASSSAATDAFGSTLLVGHVTSGSVPGALVDLEHITTGTAVWVSTPDGIVTAWTVTSLDVRANSELDPSVFGGPGPRVLSIVTCHGPVTTDVGGARHYARLLTVTAVPGS